MIQKKELQIKMEEDGNSKAEKYQEVNILQPTHQSSEGEIEAHGLKNSMSPVCIRRRISDMFFVHRTAGIYVNS